MTRSSHGMINVMVLGILLGFVAVLDAVVLARLVRAFAWLKAPSVSEDDLEDIPTVTVCIAARNETHAMTQCLERVVASDYPKLEVIVLDDGSRDNTSMLIKSFAHSGVRFIEGKPLPEGWLGKNYAQVTLAREASGKLVFFMDVDTLIERHTVARLVAFMAAKNSKMLSVVPLRSSQWRLSLLFTTMRHFWLLMRHTPERPRATSNAWMIERDVLLQQFESNEKLAQSMKVESAMAEALPRDDYQLVLSSTWLGLSFEKKWSSQVETSTRLLYPQSHKSLVRVALLLGTLLLAWVPYVAVLFTPWALVLVVAQYLMALYFLSHVWVRYRIIGALLLPITLAQEATLLVISTYKYRYGTVTWKGRPISTSK